MIADVVLFAFCVLNLVALLALARVIGTMQRRLPPVGAREMSTGPAAGSDAPAMDVIARHIGSHSDGQLILAFVTSECETCYEMLVPLRTFARAEKAAVLAVVTDNDIAGRVPSAARSFDFVVVADPELAIEYRIGMTPYFYLIGPDRRVVNHGLANNLEQLDSLARPRPEPHSHLRAESVPEIAS